MAEWLGHYVLPNARPLGTHRSSNARGLAEGMLAAGIDSHIREPFALQVPDAGFCSEKWLEKHLQNNYLPL